MPKKFISKKVAAFSGPMSTAVIAGDTVYFSGMLATDPLTGDLRLATPGVKDNRPTAQFGAGMPAGTANQGAQASQQFFQVEGFGQVIVGTRIDPRDLFWPAIARGQDQHRHRARGRTPGLEHAHPIHLGQPEIEHHGIVGGFQITTEMQGIDAV